MALRGLARNRVELMQKVRELEKRTFDRQLKKRLEEKRSKIKTFTSTVRVNCP